MLTSVGQPISTGTIALDWLEEARQDYSVSTLARQTFRDTRLSGHVLPPPGYRVSSCGAALTRLRY